MVKSNTKNGMSSKPQEDYFRNFEAFINSYEQNMTKDKIDFKQKTNSSAVGPIKPGTATAVVTGRNVIFPVVNL